MARKSSLRETTAPPSVHKKHPSTKTPCQTNGRSSGSPALLRITEAGSIPSRSSDSFLIEPCIAFDHSESLFLFGSMSETRL